MCSGRGSPTTGNNTASPGPSCACSDNFDGPACQHDDAKCKGKGAVDMRGSCVCDNPETGIGPMCTEYTNRESCSSRGVVDNDGACKCLEGYLGSPDCSSCPTSHRRSWSLSWSGSRHREACSPARRLAPGTVSRRLAAAG